MAQTKMIPPAFQNFEKTAWCRVKKKNNTIIKHYKSHGKLIQLTNPSCLLPPPKKKKKNYTPKICFSFLLMKQLSKEKRFNAHLKQMIT